MNHSLTFLVLYRHSGFRAGIRDYLPLSIGIAAWGTIAGMTMVQSGLSVPLALLMSGLVFAGSAQLIALPLMINASPTWLIWLAALCVNLRFIIFSVQWQPLFQPLPRSLRLVLGYFSGDTLFLIFTRKYTAIHPNPEQLSYYCGAALSNWLVWQVFSLLGILLGTLIPDMLSIRFAGVVALMGLSCTLLKDRQSYVIASLAALAAVLTYHLPLKLNILVAIVAALLASSLIREKTHEHP